MVEFFRKPRLTVALSAVVLPAILACGSKQKDAQSSGEPLIIKTESRDELSALFEREMELPTELQLKSPDGAWTTSVHALGPPAASVDEDGMVSTKISISKEDEVECFFYADTLDAGQAITNMFAHFSKGLSFQRIASYRVGAASGYPIVFMEGQYLFEKDGAKAMGSVKLGVSPRFETPVLCVLDSPGYRSTFATFMTDLLTHMSTKEEANEPVFTEIWAFQMGDVPVGYELTRVLKPDQGLVTNVALSAQFLPVSPSEVSTTDNVEVVLGDATGILSGHYVRIENTTSEYDIELKRDGKKKYVATGTFKEKEFKASFEAAQGLSDTVSFYKYLAKNRGKDGELNALQYSPGTQAEGPTTIRYLLDKKGTGLTIESGPQRMTAERDESGLPSSMTVPVGDREVRATLIYRTGEL